MKSTPFLLSRFALTASIITATVTVVGSVAAPAAERAPARDSVHSRHSGAPIASSVTLVRVPDGGIQPQAIMDGEGVLHVVYFKGNPAHGDLFYVHRKFDVPDSAFSAPIRVNSHEGSAIALGTIRGAQIALGRDGRVLVAWNGSDQATPKGEGGATPMLFARSNRDGSAFEAERSVLAGSEVIDGGGSIAADPKSGVVYVAWHAVTKGTGEATGGVYLTRSADGGATFAPATRLNLPPVGACGCCGMRAIVDQAGALYVLYRAATKNTDRDTMLLTSRDGGTTFEQSRLQAWRAETCPMSLFGLAPLPGGAGVIGTWETQGHVYLASLNSDASPMLRPLAVARSRGGDQKYPVVAVAPDGKRLVAWDEGAGWQRGGTLAYQVYAADGTPTDAPDFVADARRIPTWSLPAAVARPDGGFLILY